MWPTNLSHGKEVGGALSFLKSVFENRMIVRFLKTMFLRDMLLHG